MFPRSSRGLCRSGGLDPEVGRRNLSIAKLTQRHKPEILILAERSHLASKTHAISFERIN